MPITVDSIQVRINREQVIDVSHAANTENINVHSIHTQAYARIYIYIYIYIYMLLRYFCKGGLAFGGRSKLCNYVHPQKKLTT